MRAQIKCPLCNTSVAKLEEAEVEEAFKIFRDHLRTHTLSQIYDHAQRHAGLLFPEITWIPERQTEASAT